MPPKPPRTISPTTLPASGAVANPFDPGSNYLEAVPLFGSLETLFGAVDENGVEVYSSYIWPGQLAGPGDGSDGQPANQFSWAASGGMTAYHGANESVRGYAHNQWMAQSNPLPAVTTAPSLRRWFPRLNRLRRFG